MYTLSYAGVYAVPQANVRVYGPHTGDVITLCPDQDFVVVLECTVTDSSGLAWIGESLFSGTLQYSSSDELGQIEQDRTTFLLTEKRTSLFKSQLQVHSSDLRAAITENDASLNITCRATIAEESTISVRISGKYDCLNERNVLTVSERKFHLDMPTPHVTSLLAPKKRCGPIQEPSQCVYVYLYNEARSATLIKC